MEKILNDSRFYPHHRLLVTTLRGTASAADVYRWRESLNAALDEIEPNSTFKLFADLYGFVASDVEVHKEFRNVLPLTLARFGWRIGYLDLFTEAAALPLRTERGITCIAAAHCHHDETKMMLYEELFSRENEHYFATPAEAEVWIKSYVRKNADA